MLKRLHLKDIKPEGLTLYPGVGVAPIKLFNYRMSRKSLRAVPRSSQRVSRASVSKAMLRGKVLIDKNQRLWDLFRISCSVANEFKEV